MPYKYIKGVNVKGKTLVLRVDLNSDVENGKLVVSARIREHAKTIKKLSSLGAKLVVLAHQGRKGEADCIPLDQHAAALAHETGMEIELVSWDENYAEIIMGAKPSSILLLDNVRFNDDEETEKTAEEHSKSAWVKKIASTADFYVQDALSVCHRQHASVVGFAPLLKCYIGPLLEQELRTLRRVENGEKPCYFILGGVKVDDSIKLMQHLLENRIADAVLVCGLLGELFLLANGKSLGAKEAFIKEKGFQVLLPDAKALLEKYAGKIILPIDVAFEESGLRTELAVEELPSSSMIYDIGKKTIELFKQKIADARLIVLNGPAGAYENDLFEDATRELMKAVSKGKAFSILGGGDTETAVEKFGFTAENFGHLSLAGKALLNYLSGKELPGLKALQ